MKKLEFKPEDFDDDNGGYGPYCESLSRIAQEIFDKWYAEHIDGATDMRNMKIKNVDIRTIFGPLEDGFYWLRYEDNLLVLVTRLNSTVPPDNNWVDVRTLGKKLYIAGNNPENTIIFPVEPPIEEKP